MKAKTTKSNAKVGGKRRPTKCTRGKKVCPSCASLVPIHCFECSCGYKFEIKKKRKDDPLALPTSMLSVVIKPLSSLLFDTHQPSAFSM